MKRNNKELEAARILLGIDPGESVVDAIERLVQENDQLRGEIKFLCTEIVREFILPPQKPSPGAASAKRNVQ